MNDNDEKTSIKIQSTNSTKKEGEAESPSGHSHYGEFYWYF